MFSKLSLFALFFILASMFIVSSAVPMADIQVEERGCGRWACMDVLSGSASEFQAETSSSVFTTTTTETSPAEFAATSTQAAQSSVAAVLSSSKSSGAVFNMNAPVLSCFVGLATSATIFTFLL